MPEAPAADRTRPIARAERTPLHLVLTCAGAVPYLLLVGLVPIFFIPPALATLDTVAQEITFFKSVAARLLCVTVYACAIGVLLAGKPRLRGAVVLPTVVLGLYGLHAAIAALASPDAGFSLGHVTTELALLLTVGLAPLFLDSLSRTRAMLAAALTAAVLAAGFGLVAAAGFSGIYSAVYGADPVEIARQGMQSLMGRVEGTPMRAAMMSTFGNPEYAGTFYAGGFLLAFCWVLDGWGVERLRGRRAWAVGVLLAGMLALAILASQTRSALLAVFAGMLVRWLVALPLRGAWIAGGLTLLVGVGVLFGPRPAGLLLVACCALVLAWQARTGDLVPRWHSIPVRTRLLALLVPVAGIVLLFVGTVYDPVGLRVRELGERLATATSSADFSVRQRLIFLLMASEMLRENPFLGVGPGFFPTHYHETLARLVADDPSGLMRLLQLELGSWIAFETHNDYFQIAAERGIPGIVLFLGLMSAVLAGLARVARGGDSQRAGAARVLVVALCGYLTIMLTSFPLLEAARQATFWGLLAAAFGLLAGGEQDAQQ